MTAIAVRIDRLGADEWQTLRDVRPAALGDSPGAFWGATGGEARFGRAEWTALLRAGRGSSRATTRARCGWRPDCPVPTVRTMSSSRCGSRRRPGPRDPHHADPSGDRLGDRLARSCAEHAGDRRIDTAGTLYQQFDVVLTGEWAPMPHDPATGDWRMRRVLSSTQ